MNFMVCFDKGINTAGSRSPLKSHGLLLILVGLLMLVIHPGTIAVPTAALATNLHVHVCIEDTVRYSPPSNIDGVGLPGEDLKSVRRKGLA